MEKTFNENEVVELIYSKINSNWYKFPNIWNITSKDEIASEVIIDLYRKRKVDGVSHIQHYYETKGERSLGQIISLVVHNNMIAVARNKFIGGAARNENKRLIENACSLDVSYSDDEDGSTLSSIIPDPDVNVEATVDYYMLYDNLPDKVIDGVYIKVSDNKYQLVSYKTLVEQLISGYNVREISDKLFKQVETGWKPCDNVYNLVKTVRDFMKSYLLETEQVPNEYVGGKCR